MIGVRGKNVHNASVNPYISLIIHVEWACKIGGPTSIALGPSHPRELPGWTQTPKIKRLDRYNIEKTKLLI